MIHVFFVGSIHIKPRPEEKWVTLLGIRKNNISFEKHGNSIRMELKGAACGYLSMIFLCSLVRCSEIGPSPLSAVSIAKWRAGAAGKAAQSDAAVRKKLFFEQADAAASGLRNFKSIRSLGIDQIESLTHVSKTGKEDEIRQDPRTTSPAKENENRETSHQDMHQTGDEKCSGPAVLSSTDALAQKSMKPLSRMASNFIQQPRTSEGMRKGIPPYAADTPQFDAASPLYPAGAAPAGFKQQVFASPLYPAGAAPVKQANSMHMGTAMRSEMSSPTRQTPFRTPTTTHGPRHNEDYSHDHGETSFQSVTTPHAQNIRDGTSTRTQRKDSIIQQEEHTGSDAHAQTGSRADKTRHDDVVMRDDDMDDGDLDARGWTQSRYETETRTRQEYQEKQTYTDDIQAYTDEYKHKHLNDMHTQRALADDQTDGQHEEATRTSSHVTESQTPYLTSTHTENLAQDDDQIAYAREVHTDSQTPYKTSVVTSQQMMTASQQSVQRPLDAQQQQDQNVMHSRDMQTTASKVQYIDEALYTDANSGTRTLSDANTASKTHYIDGVVHTGPSTHTQASSGANAGIAASKMQYISLKEAESLRKQAHFHTAENMHAVASTSRAAVDAVSSRGSQEGISTSFRRVDLPSTARRVASTSRSIDGIDELPPGWQRHITKTPKRRVYYSNPDNGTQWEPPTQRDYILAARRSGDKSDATRDVPATAVKNMPYTDTQTVGGTGGGARDAVSADAGRASGMSHTQVKAGVLEDASLRTHMKASGSGKESTRARPNIDQRSESDTKPMMSAEKLFSMMQRDRSRGVHMFEGLCAAGAITNDHCAVMVDFSTSVLEIQRVMRRMSAAGMRPASTTLALIHQKLRDFKLASESSSNVTGHVDVVKPQEALQQTGFELASGNISAHADRMDVDTTVTGHVSADAVQRGHVHEEPVHVRGIIKSDAASKSDSYGGMQTNILRNYSTHMQPQSQKSNIDDVMDVDEVTVGTRIQTGQKGSQNGQKVTETSFLQQGRRHTGAVRVPTHSNVGTSDAEMNGAKKSAPQPGAENPNKYDDNGNNNNKNNMNKKSAAGFLNADRYKHIQSRIKAAKESMKLQDRTAHDEPLPTNTSDFATNIMNLLDIRPPRFSRHTVTAALKRLKEGENTNKTSANASQTSENVVKTGQNGLKMVSYPVVSPSRIAAAYTLPKVPRIQTLLHVPHWWMTEADPEVVKHVELFLRALDVSDEDMVVLDQVKDEKRELRERLLVMQDMVLRSVCVCMPVRVYVRAFIYACVFVDT